jgi:hypothetical protein
VLGAWKFQQGKFCNCGKSGLGFLVIFCFCFQPRKASSSAERGTRVRSQRGRIRSKTARVGEGTATRVDQVARVRQCTTARVRRKHRTCTCDGQAACVRVFRTVRTCDIYGQVQVRTADVSKCTGGS